MNPVLPILNAISFIIMIVGILAAGGTIMSMQMVAAGSSITLTPLPHWGIRFL